MQYKKSLSLFLVSIFICFSLIGCNSSSNDVSGTQAINSSSTNLTSTGMFVERTITPNESEQALNFMSATQQDAEVTLTASDRQGTLLSFTSSDRQTWQESKNSIAGQLFSSIFTEGFVSTATMPKQDIWWITQSYSGYRGDQTAEEAKQNAIKTYKVNGDSIEEVNIESIQTLNTESTEYSVGTMTSANGTVHILLYESTFEGTSYYITFDGETGQELTKIGLNAKEYDLWSAFCIDNSLYVPSQTSNQIFEFSLETGEEISKMNIPVPDYKNSNTIFTVAPNKDLCYVNNTGIHRVPWGGSLVQDMVVGNQYSFSSPFFYPTSLLAMEDGSYIVVGNNQSESVVSHFEFDENASNTVQDKLMIWSLEDSYVLRAAVTAYNKKNPEITIEVEYGRNPNISGKTDSDIIRELNTRLLTGNSPDIIILDGLPSDAYIKQGLLLDLSGEINIENCYPNIMSAFTKNNKTYAYPTLFQMPVFIARSGEEYSDGISSLSELSQIASEKDSLYYGNYYEMFESLYAAYSNTIFPNNASVDETALRDFLQNTKTISDELQLSSEIEYIHGGVGSSGIPPRQGLNALAEDSTKYAADILWEPTFTSTLFLFADREITPLPGNSFIPICSAAISTQTLQKEIAIDFINTMLQDKDTQGTRMEQGFSVIVDEHLSLYKKNGSDLVGNPDLFDWNALILQFTAPTITDKDLQEKLYEQAELLYQGKINVNEATNAILQNTKTYFAEKQ